MNGNSNIDSYVENQIKKNLESSVSNNFTGKLMNKIELDKKYMFEDKKIFRSVKIIMASLVLVLTALIFASVMLIEPLLVNTPFNSGNVIAGMEEFIDNFLIKIADIIGFTFSLQSILFLIIILFSFILFTFSERKLTKKSPSN